MTTVKQAFHRHRVASKRTRSISMTLQAGCLICHGDKAHWLGRNAQAVAARHHDTTGHRTWVDTSARIIYGEHEYHPDLFGGSTPC